MPRRFVNATVTAFAYASAAVLTAVAGGLLAPASATPSDSSPVPPGKPDQLRFTVMHSGSPADDGTYLLECHPTGGNHPRPDAACGVLTAASGTGKHPFEPVPAGANCTHIYGGPAVARVAGLWHGREVEATFKRTDGCEIERWDALLPALPRTRG